mmetsp:Transcript_21968/g.45177  ORF Transcript_21968/g.45177 Transcript_21968/m.45177 type:complete len:250 (+) Transcript_21968:353-1102(+)
MEIESVGLQRDFSVLVVSSVDNVVNEVAVTLFVAGISVIHVLGHDTVVAHVDVALGTAFEKGSAHTNNIVKFGVRSFNVFSVDTISSVHLFVTFFVFLELVSSVTGDALVGKVEEGFVIVTVSKNLGDGDSLAHVLNTVFVRENTKGDSVVVRSTVGSNVVLLSVFIGVSRALKELVQLVLVLLGFLVVVVVLGVILVFVVLVSLVVVSILSTVHALVSRLVQVRAVFVVVLADVLITRLEVLVDIVLA